MTQVTGSFLEDSGALISPDGLYRYRLWRIWDYDAPTMVWVMLNPSTADGMTDDPTIRKCIGFAKANRHGGIIVVNLFAWRATDPKALKAIKDPIGPENDDHISWACRAPMLATIVAGWGANKAVTLKRRDIYVKTNLRSVRREIKCLGTTVAGHPKHPLFIPYTTPLESLP